MKIFQPQVTIRDGRAVLSARLGYDRRPLDKPEEAWISFPERFAGALGGRADAFAAGLLPLAMAIGEDLEVEGSLSPRLAAGLEEYQRALHFWFPRQQQRVAIRAASLEALPPALAGQGCATLFSGGVDSSFTLMSHQPDRQPLADFQARYALFVHGFDVPLQERRDYDLSLESLARELAPAGVEVIGCATNLRYLTSGLLKWRIPHGAALVAVGLALDRLLRYLLVPATYELDELIPLGTSPMIDHWLSTDTLTVIHHGATTSRNEKVEAISTWEPAQRFLRVCIDDRRRAGVENCCRCEKCFRTMLMLEMCGKLGAFRTFPRPFRRGDILHWVPRYEEGEVLWMTNTYKFARSHGKTGYLPLLRFAHFRGLLRAWPRKMIPAWLFPWLKRRVFFPYEKDPFNPVFVDNNIRA
jgi:hypothetical protein